MTDIVKENNEEATPSNEKGDKNYPIVSQVPLSPTIMQDTNDKDLRYI